MPESLINENRREKWLIAALMLIGVLVRVWGLDRFPGGINQDEAYSAYEAYCLLTDGMDSWGYRFPVYFRSWGSGMNVLQSYLMIPFIALFGIRTWVIRLPQLLIACVSLPVFYALIKRMFGRRAALIGLFVLTICPWHIMLSRWGLESNLAVGLLLFGMYAFVRGTENSRWFVLSALLYGLSLYAYASIWPVVPAMLALLLGALLLSRRLRPDRWVLLSVALLAMLAAPLIAFVLVNMGVLEEIHTAVFSIPRLLSMRTYDFNLGNIRENIYDMVMMMLRQRDDTVWNATPEFGLYYHISLPFMFLGGMRGLVMTVDGVRKREWRDVMPVMAQLLCAAVLGLFIESNVNRLNCIHFPAIILIVLGIDTACGWLQKRIRRVYAGVLMVYTICFVLFTGYYFTDFQQKLDLPYDAGLEEALAYAKTVTEGEICVSDEISYPKILFYGQVEPEVFRESVVWRGEPGSFMQIDTVDRYRFGVDETVMHEGVCIVKASELHAGIPEGTQVHVFEQVAVVHGADQQ